MIFYPTTACKDYSVFRVPKTNPDSLDCFVKVGCRKCSTCDKERVEQKQKKGRTRLREYMLYWESLGNRVVFCTFTVHPDDIPEGASGSVNEDWYPIIKKRMQGMLKAFGMACKRWYDERVKYWCVLEYGGKTDRLHAHVFFFVPNHIPWMPLWAYLREYWTSRYKAYILDSKLVVGAAMAANYATKYAVNQVGHNRDRMLTSQFGWIKFMQEVKRKWHGLNDEEGVTEWLAVVTPNVNDEAVLTGFTIIRSKG